MFDVCGVMLCGVLMMEWLMCVCLCVCDVVVGMVLCVGVCCMCMLL